MPMKQHKKSELTCMTDSRLVPAISHLLNEEKVTDGMVVKIKKATQKWTVLDVDCRCYKHSHAEYGCLD